MSVVGDAAASATSAARTFFAHFNLTLAHILYSHTLDACAHVFMYVCVRLSACFVVHRQLFGILSSFLPSEHIMRIVFLLIPFHRFAFDGIKTANENNVMLSMACRHEQKVFVNQHKKLIRIYRNRTETKRAKKPNEEME